MMRLLVAAYPIPRRMRALQTRYGSLLLAGLAPLVMMGSEAFFDPQAVNFAAFNSSLATNQTSSLLDTVDTPLWPQDHCEF